MPKAAVLPLPVLACAIRSRRSRITGRLCAWIGVMLWYPSESRFASNEGDSGKDENDVSDAESDEVSEEESGASDINEKPIRKMTCRRRDRAMR